MGETLTLIADVLDPPFGQPELPADYGMRRVRRSDVDALGRVYFEAYEPEVAASTLEEATTDIRASFDGEYGELWEAASPVATYGDDIVAAVLTVRRAPWDDTPECPFVIETFTARRHRRRGLARALLAATSASVSREDARCMALRVDADNVAALGLYQSLGFRSWQSGHSTRVE